MTEMSSRLEPFGPSAAARTSGLRIRVAVLVAGASGFIALSYEILWYRLYSYVSWGAPAAFGALLGFYLLGIAIGSFASRRFCTTHAAEGTDRSALRVLAAFLFFANLCGFLVAPALGRLSTFCPWLWSLGLVLVATAMLGAVLPLVS